MVAPGKKVEDVEAAINEEIERLQREPIADWELDKAKNSARRGSIQSLQSSLGGDPVERIRGLYQRPGPDQHAIRNSPPSPKPTCSAWRRSI